MVGAARLLTESGRASVKMKNDNRVELAVNFMDERITRASKNVHMTSGGTRLCGSRGICRDCYLAVFG